MPMYNLIKDSDDYSKTSGRLQQYYRDEPNDNLAGSGSFKSRAKITGKTTKTLQMALMPLISLTCVIINSTGAEKFSMADTKLPVVT